MTSSDTAKAAGAPDGPGAADHDPLAHRRFVRGALLFFAAVFGLVWLWVAEAPMVYYDGHYPALLAKVKLEEETRPDNVPILGDSQPEAALIPRRLGPGVVNLAWAGRSTIEALHFVRAELRHPSPPRAIIISISPSHFMEPDLFWSYSVGTGLLSYREVEEVRRRAALLGDTTLFNDHSPGQIDTRLENLLYTLRFPSYYFGSLLQLRGLANYEFNRQRFEQVYQDRGWSPVAPPGHIYEPDREVTLKSFVPAKILDDYFNQTLALCAAHAIPVYFVAMPHNEFSAINYAPEMKREFTDYLAGYSRRYPGFHVLGDLFLAYPTPSFGDAAHLGPDAAARWSDDVAKMLNDARAPGGPFGPN